METSSSSWWRDDGAVRARTLALAIIISTTGFTLIKTASSAAVAFGWMLGLAQWLLSLPIRILADLALPPIAPAVVVADPTDLLALPGLTLAILVGMSRLRNAGQAGWGGAARRPIQ